MKALPQRRRGAEESRSLVALNRTRSSGCRLPVSIGKGAEERKAIFCGIRAGKRYTRALISSLA
jgi:hypothetical protein